MQFKGLMESANGILFDFNGTLSNDEEVLENAYDLTLAELGLNGLEEGEYASLLGRSDPDITRAVLDKRGEGHRNEEFLRALADSYVAASISAGCLHSDSVELLKWLLAENKKVGIVTGTLRPMIVPVLAKHGLVEELDCLVTIENVQAGKPDPEGFELGAKLLGLAPEDIVVMEDSHAGFAAADSLGMRVVGIGSSIASTHLAAHYPTMVDVAAEVVGRED